MQRLFSTFPNRWPGLGILLLRCAVGFAAILRSVESLNTNSAQSWHSLTLAILSIVAGCFLIAGLLTPIACVVLITCCVVDAVAPTMSFDHQSTGALIQTIVIAVSIALLGPGALSFDSRLFGRREIIIPEIGPRYRNH